MAVFEVLGAIIMAANRKNLVLADFYVLKAIDSSN